MRNTKTWLLIFILVLGWQISELKAQNGTLTTGGNFSSPSGSISYSVGQIDYVELVGSGGSANPGKQQPYEFWVVSGIEVPGIDLSLAVYPNPTTDMVLLEIDNNAFEGLHYTLVDLNGQLLQKDEVHQPITQIDLTQYSMGPYFLQVYEGGYPVKVFKVIKNQ